MVIFLYNLYIFVCLQHFWGLSLNDLFFLGGGGGGGGGGGYGPFMNISLISRKQFIKGGRKPENHGKNHLTIRKQNLVFPYVTQARLEPQQ